MKKLYSLILFSAVFINSHATILNVPATYSTIQSALNVCTTDDTVLVQPGTYIENIIWPNTSGISLLSAGDSSNTIINGNQIGSVLSFSAAAVDTNTLIRGFKITDGYLSGNYTNGGGIYIHLCSPKFDAVSVTGNHINATNWGYGAGVYCENSNTVFANTAIWANTTDSSTWGFGGGIYMTNGGSPIFRNVKIVGNHVNSSSWNYGAGVHCSGANPAFINVSVTGNTTGKNAIWYYGTGMFFENCNASLTNVLVASNTMETGGNWYYGGGISVYYNSTSPIHITMMNVTIADNKKIDGTSISGSGISSETGDTLVITNSILWNNNPGYEINNLGSLSIIYSDVRGSYTGTGNISGSPAFVSATDFHLSASSPCLGAGTLAGAPSFDLDNNPRPFPTATNPDMGCYENSQPNAIYNLTSVNGLVNNYPNPFSSTTIFSVSKTITKENDYSFTVIDATERIVKRISTISSDTFTFSREDLVNGIYFYQLQIKEKIIGSGKMVVD